MSYPAWAGTPQQRWALARLVRLLALAATPLDPAQRQLLSQALRSTYADCDALGLARQATLITQLASACRAPPATNVDSDQSSDI